MENSLLASIKNLQDKANQKWIDLFFEKGLPSKNDDGFSYFSLDKFYQETLNFSEKSQAIEKDQLPKSKSGVRFVFVDGQFSQDLSDLSSLNESVVYSGYEEAKKDYFSLIASHEEKLLLQPKEHGLDFLTEAFCLNGFFLYIPPKLILEQKIELLFVGRSIAASFSKILIYVGKGASASINVSFEETSTQWINSNFYLTQEPSSSCKIVYDFTKAAHSWIFHKMVTRVKKEATSKVYLLDKGSKGLRKELQFDLLDVGASALCKGISLVTKGSESHQVVKMNHIEENTTSTQHFKNLVLDKAKASFDGKIWVDPKALKTSAYQLCNHLLLSETAQGFVKPNLEIFADDVKASHGATISYLDQESLFYLNSRGMNDQEAKNILIKAFAKEILQELAEHYQIEFLNHLKATCNIS